MTVGNSGRSSTRSTQWVADARSPGQNAAVIVESTREGSARIEQETRFYIISLALPANVLGPIIRSHRAIENGLHRVMDMIFRDDECRVRTDRAPANFATIKHTALKLIRTASGKVSLRLKRKTAGWDDDFLAGLLTQ
ncbi:MAG: ISAs1 family transposase [Acetobacteraceae bacterium]